MATYSPLLNSVTWAGILFQGEMDGEMYSAEHKEDDVTLHVGGKGLTTYVVSADKSGMFTARLSQKSPTNARLSAAFAAGLVGPLLMRDLSDTTVVSGADVRIAKHPAIKRGKEIDGLEWKFIVPKLVLVAGGDQ